MSSYWLRGAKHPGWKAMCKRQIWDATFDEVFAWLEELNDQTLSVYDSAERQARPRTEWVGGKLTARPWRRNPRLPRLPKGMT